MKMEIYEGNNFSKRKNYFQLFNAFIIEIYGETRLPQVVYNF